MSRQVLVDYMPFHITPQLIEEAMQKHGGKLIVSGVIQRADALNQNKRRYPKNILRREVGKYGQLVTERRALGELDHPESSVVNLANASHLITELRWEGDDLIGTIEVLSTPSGNILKELFKCGVKVGISSRGLGSIRAIGDGAVEVQDDYEILCWDMVSNPSIQGSFVYPNTHITENIDLTKTLIGKYDAVDKIVMDILSYMNQ